MEGCPRWEKFLKETLGSKGAVQEAQIFLGRALFPSGVGHQAALDKPVINAG